eukprot:g39256.t1
MKWISGIHLAETKMPHLILTWNEIAIQLLELKKQLETESNLHTKTKELLKNAEKEISTLKLHLNNVETKLAETKGGDSKGKSSTEDDVDDLQSQLRQAEEQANELRERLETATSNVEQYRDMALSLEESLSKEKQVTEEVRTAVESRLKEAAEYQAQLEKRMLEAENEKQALTDEKRKAIENLEQQHAATRVLLKFSQPTPCCYQPATRLGNKSPTPGFTGQLTHSVAMLPLKMPP